MKVSRSILEKFLDEKYGGAIEKHHNGEWVLPSIENPSKKKLYVNVGSGAAIDFIGGKGYTARTLIGAIMGIRGANELDQFITDYTIKNMRLVNTREYFETPQIQVKKPTVIYKIEMPLGCVSLFDSKADKALAYIRGRGFDNDDIEHYKLMYCTEGRFRDRVIIPFIENNQIVWFQGRAVGPNPMRYDNPQDVEKSMIVFNIDAITDTAIINEGPIDAMTVNGQAITGSTISEWQVAKILDRNPKKIIVVPDNDYDAKKKLSPGYEGALKTIESFVKAKFPLKSIYVAFVTNGKDLNSLGKQKALETIKNAVPFSFGTLIKFGQYNAHSEYLQKRV